MTEGERHIVESAGQLFARYGISKTTMVDIARLAGVSRQTVYNAFPGKDEILRAVILLQLNDKKAKLKRSWQDEPEFGKKLDSLFAELPLAWYDQVQASPDAAEMIDGVNRTSKEELSGFSKAVVAMLTAQIEALGASIPVSPGDLADYVYSAAISLKYDAHDRDDLVRKLAVLRESTLALLNGPQ